MAPIEARLARARALARDPRIKVTAIEAALGTRYTVDTVAALERRYPQLRLVWLMGADNLAELAHWRRWPALFRALPIAILDRPTYSRRALASPAAKRFARFRVQPACAQGLADRTPPAWTFVRARLHGESATRIRREGRWPAAAPGKVRIGAP